MGGLGPGANVTLDGKARGAAPIDVTTTIGRHKVEVNLHARGKDIHCEAVELDMYAAIDALVDKLDRQVVKHKEKLALHRHEGAAIKREVAATEAMPAPVPVARGGVSD